MIKLSFSFITYDDWEEDEKDLSELSIGMKLMSPEWWEQKGIEIDQDPERYDDYSHLKTKLELYATTIEQEFIKTFQISKYKQLAISLCPFFLSPSYIPSTSTIHMDVSLKCKGETILSQITELYQIWFDIKDVGGKFVEMYYGYVKTEDQNWLIFFQNPTSIGIDYLGDLNAIWLMEVDEAPEHY